MVLFAGKMFCGNCESAYIRRHERGKYRWTCKSNNGNPECRNNIVSEDAMVEFISRRLYVEERTPDKISKFIEGKLDSVVVNGANNFMVHLKGQDPMFMKPGHIHY